MTTTFADLGVSSAITEALSNRGITEPFSIQEIAIPDALAGRDVCGKAKTGSGKTLAFGIPVLEGIERAEPKRPHAIALVPTRELAVQVAEELEPLAKASNVRVAAVYGGANIERQIARLEKGVDFVVATPGRMIDLVERKAVSLEFLTHVIVDEADRMADMGFLPQVEWLLRQAKNEHQTLLFSATLDGVVDSLVRRYQTDPVFHEVESREVTVDQMIHRFVQVHQMDRSRSPQPSLKASTVRLCSPRPSTWPTGWPASSRSKASRLQRSMETCAKSTGSKRLATSLTAS